jgi:hypothetical protein
LQSPPVMGGDWIDKMKINLENWEHKRLNSKKLPSEEDLQDFLSCIVTDPANKMEGFFETANNFDYVEKRNGSSGYRADSYPILNSEIHGDPSWITPCLNNLNLNTKLSTSQHSLISNEEEYGKCTHQRNVPSIALALGTEIVSSITTAADTNCLSKEWTIKNFTDLNSIVYSVKNFIKSFSVHEGHVFKLGLDSQGYIQQNSHSEVLEKIKKLRALCPSETIYIIAETPLLDYLDVHGVAPGRLETNSRLIMDDNRNHFYGNSGAPERLFGSYKSAIFTTSFMSSSHEFEVYYNLQRENRRWKIYLGIVGKLGMNIPKDPVGNVPLRSELHNHHPRWDRLF